MKFNNEQVIKAQDGDIHAFEMIVDAFSDMAIGYAYSILSDYQQAEDVAQDSFVQAFYKLKTIQTSEAFPSWFRKIVFSQCEHYYRKKRLPVIPLDDVIELQSQEQSPSEIVERDELKNQIIKAVKALPEKERTITVLFYISEYSMAEIGKFLDLPISTIKNRLFSARKKLHKEMADHMGDTLKEQKSNIKIAERVKKMIISGYKHALLVKEDGTVMNWGNHNHNADPKSANGQAKPVAVMGLKDVKSIAAASGCYRSFALLDDGTVWTWGWNIFQHLGTGSKDEYIMRPEKVQNLGDVVSVSAGVSHALALKKDGSVWAWGRNWYGQLGNSQVNSEYRGYEDNDAPASIPGLDHIRQISAGYFHSLALAEDGSVWRWGGYGDSTFRFPIVYATNTPVQIKAPGRIIAISAGGMHDVLLSEDGSVWACGYNTLRQLGNSSVFNEVLDSPVQVRKLSDVKAISAGGGFTLALKNDGTVWAWGCNENGELGNGVFDAKTEMNLNDQRNEPIEVSMLQDVIEIAAGGSHAMAITRDGSIWAWGSNDEGQLGVFSESKRCVPQKII